MKRRISRLTQQLILAELNNLCPRPLMLESIRVLFPGIDNDTITVAVRELTDNHLVKVTYGKKELKRRILMTWTAKGRELWNAALPLLFSPIRVTRMAAMPEPTSDFTPSGESLLAIRSPWYVLHTRPCFAYKFASSLSNASHIQPMHFRHAECAIQFWYYPPILPGLEYIDNLSLYLALKSAKDPAADLYGWFLVESHNWDVRRASHHPYGDCPDCL